MVKHSGKGAGNRLLMKVSKFQVLIEPSKHLQAQNPKPARNHIHKKELSAHPQRLLPSPKPLSLQTLPGNLQLLQTPGSEPGNSNRLIQ
jgi:hypothetical protein